MSSSESGVVLADRMNFEGGRNVTYDLTGSDPRFYKHNEFMIHTEHQLITLKAPVFGGTIEVERAVDQSEVYDEELGRMVSQTTWETVERDDTGETGWRWVAEDSDAKSKALLLDPGFSSALVRQIQINMFDATQPNIHLRVKFHLFYMDVYEFNQFDGVGPKYTPALGNYLLGKIGELEASIATNIKNTYASTDNVNDMLKEDLTGRASDNYVQHEIHVASAAKGIYKLMPARGAFYDVNLHVYQYMSRTGSVQEANREENIGCLFIYSDTIQIADSSSTISTTKRVLLTEENYDTYLNMVGTFIDIKPGNLKELIRDIDYKPVDLNIAKTEKSISSLSVYDSIRLLKSFNCGLLVSYQAFGGEVVLSDIQSLRQDVLNVISILSSNTSLTTESLVRQPVVRDLLRRLQTIEQYHSHFGRVEHAIHTNQPGYHWFNIAELYDVAWGSDLSVIDDIGTFRIESTLRKWCYEFILSVDLKKKIVDALRCKVLATNNVASSDFKNYDVYFADQDDVAVRVCWKDNGTTSGVMLQVGWNFNHYVDPTENNTDTLIVTNKSGPTSKWKLVYNPLDITYDADATTKILNHVMLKQTTDTTYQSGKVYFQYTDVFSYFKTSDLRVKADRSKYYTIKNGEYVSALSEYPAMGEGELIADVIRNHLTSGVFERQLYNRVPKKITVTPGEPVVDGVYEVDTTTSTDDSSFSLPNTSQKWYEDAIDCYKLTRILEPSDGYMVWVGSLPINRNLDLTHGIQLNTVMDDLIQKQIMLSSIRGATFRFYDRKTDRIVSRAADVGYNEERFIVTSDTERDPSKTYYVKSMSGNDRGPFRYRKIEPTETFSSDTTYYEKQSASCVHGHVIFDLLDLCSVEFCVERDSNDRLNIQLRAYVGTDSLINERYDLRQIDFHF